MRLPAVSTCRLARYVVRLQKQSVFPCELPSYGDAAVSVESPTMREWLHKVCNRNQLRPVPVPVGHRLSRVPEDPLM